MSIAKFILAGLLALALCGTAAAADQLQSPYGNQTLPAPSSPYPDQGSSPYGGGSGQAPPRPAYPPAQQPSNPPAGGYPQQPPAQPQPAQPQPAGGPTLVDVLGNFRLGLPQGAVAGGATYNFALPGQQAQVTIMSLASPQAFAAQQQNFPSLLAQMGGRITEQRQINLAGRPAELVVAVVNNPQYNAQMVAYNVFVASANLWLQVTGAAANQAQVQQAASQLLQALTLR
ncbi:MAG: hypothetical protein V1797_09195 [Pseudomonadota bacterium]